MATVENKNNNLHRQTILLSAVLPTVLTVIFQLLIDYLGNNGDQGFPEPPPTAPEPSLQVEPGSSVNCKIENGSISIIGDNNDFGQTVDCSQSYFNEHWNHEVNYNFYTSNLYQLEDYEHLIEAGYWLFEDSTGLHTSFGEITQVFNTTLERAGSGRNPISLPLILAGAFLVEAQKLKERGENELFSKKRGPSNTGPVFGQGDTSEYKPPVIQEEGCQEDVEVAPGGSRDWLCSPDLSLW